MRLLATSRRHPALALAALSITVTFAACSGSTQPVAPAVTSSTATTSTTAAKTTAAPTTTAPCSTLAKLASWSVARLAAQTIVVPVQESNIASVERDVAGGVGGVILFGSSAPPDLARQLSALGASAPGGIAPLVMTDEEGGAVQRMANLVGTVPSAREMGATMSPAQIEQTARALATAMRAAGVTMDLAPVLDVDGGQGPNDRDPDGTRSFGANEMLASTDARAFAAGLAQGGVTAVAKHFPGLGGATGNTDVMPATTRPWSELQQTGLVPFVDIVATHVPAIMVGNAVVPGLTTLPAGISASAITGVLRDRLGYRGLVLTDSLSAAALRDIGYSVPRAATAALAAGADMVLYDTANAGRLAAQTVDAIVAAERDGRVGRARLERAVSHILAVKRVELCAAGRPRTQAGRTVHARRHHTMLSRHSHCRHLAVRGLLPAASILVTDSGGNRRQQRGPPMMLNWPTFVLQRRINVPLDAVERVLCAPHLIRGGAEFDLPTNAMHMRLQSPFGVMFPPFGFERASWCAPANVYTRRGRRIVQLEIEINAWDASSTEVVVRPRARHPYRWSGRRLREYFRVAHLTADLFTQFLRHHAESLATSQPSTDLARSVV